MLLLLLLLVLLLVRGLARVLVLFAHVGKKNETNKGCGGLREKNEGSIYTVEFGIITYFLIYMWFVQFDSFTTEIKAFLFIDTNGVGE